MNWRLHAKAMGKAALAFAVAAVTTGVLVSGFSVFVLGDYYRKFGRLWSFEMDIFVQLIAQGLGILPVSVTALALSLRSPARSPRILTKAAAIGGVTSACIVLFAWRYHALPGVAGTVVMATVAMRSRVKVESGHA